MCSVHHSGIVCDIHTWLRLTLKQWVVYNCARKASLATQLQFTALFSTNITSTLIYLVNQILSLFLKPCVLELNKITRQ